MWYCQPYGPLCKQENGCLTEDALLSEFWRLLRDSDPYTPTANHGHGPGRSHLLFAPPSSSSHPLHPHPFWTIWTTWRELERWWSKWGGHRDERPTSITCFRSTAAPPLHTLTTVTYNTPLLWPPSFPFTMTSPQQFERFTHNVVDTSTSLLFLFYHTLLFSTPAGKISTKTWLLVVIFSATGWNRVEINGQPM